MRWRAVADGVGGTRTSTVDPGDVRWFSGTGVSSGHLQVARGLMRNAERLSRIFGMSHEPQALMRSALAAGLHHFAAAR